MNNITLTIKHRCVNLRIETSYIHLNTRGAINAEKEYLDPLNLI